jgi:choline/glycine/proline betaine transport protein
MNSIATKNASQSPKWQLVFWGVMLAVLALVLLSAGGLQSLQTMTLITALPFSVIMILFCVSLVKGLAIDNHYYTRGFSPATSFWSGEFWKDRLHQIISFKKRGTVIDFLARNVRPAMEELAAEFNRNGILASVSTAHDISFTELKIKHELIEDFIYGVRVEAKAIAGFLVNEENMPGIDGKKNFIPITYFGDSRIGYNVEYFARNEIIADILRQYERFVELSSEVRNELFTNNPLRNTE